MARLTESRAGGANVLRFLDLIAFSEGTSTVKASDDGAKFAAAVSCPGTDTAAVARGKAATRAAMVLSDLLARADARAGELAKAYDQARIAGEQCQREYDALSATGER